MKSKTWLILLTLTAVIILAFSGQVTSSYFSDRESSIDNVLRIKFPFLLSADNFAVLAGSTVTNVGDTIVDGDIGVSPGTVVDGFPPGTVNGTIHLDDAAAIQAQADLVIAYNDAAGRPATPIGDTLGEQDLPPGVYHGGALDLTGDLILTGDANDVWIFQAESSLTTADGSRVILGGTARADNVYWKVGSSATLGADSIFKGNILALTSITLITGVELEGRALARNGTVTLGTNIITKPAP